MVTEYCGFNSVLPKHDKGEAYGTFRGCLMSPHTFITRGFESREEVAAQRHPQAPPFSTLEKPLLKERSRTRPRVASKAAAFPTLTGLISVLAVVFVFILCFRKPKRHGGGASGRRLAEEGDSDGLEAQEEEQQQRDLCQTREPEVSDGESDAHAHSSGEGEATDEEDLYAEPPTTFYQEPQGLSTSAPRSKIHRSSFKPRSAIFPRGVYVPLPTNAGELEVLEEPRDTEGDSPFDGDSAREAASRRAKEAAERSVKSLDALTLLLQEGFEALLACEAENPMTTSTAAYVNALARSLAAQAEWGLLACGRWAPWLSRQSLLNWEGTIIKAQTVVSGVRSMFNLIPEELEESGPMAGMPLGLLMITRMQYVHHDVLSSVEKLFREGVQEAAVVGAHLADVEELVGLYNHYESLMAFRPGTHVYEQLSLRERKLRGVLDPLRPVVKAFEIWGTDPGADPLTTLQTHINAVSGLFAIHKEYPERFIARGLVPWLSELKRVVNVLREPLRGGEGWGSKVRFFLKSYVQPFMAPNEAKLARTLLGAEGLIARVEQRLREKGVNYD
ncbi:hypothetical protein Emed_004406 [Eimeria media]